MPFKYYIQRIEGKEKPLSKYDLVRYKKIEGGYRYGVRVFQGEGVYNLDRNVWAAWADTPNEAVELYEMGLNSGGLKPVAYDGLLRFISKRVVEEYDHAI